MNVPRWLSRILPGRRSTAAPAGTPATPEKWIIDWFNGGLVTDSGTDVSPETAMRMTSVWACVRLLTGVLSTLPVQIVERIDAKQRRQVDDHAARWLLHEDMNDDLAAVMGRGMLQVSQELRGNGYAAIEFSGAGRPLAMHPLLATRVNVKRINRRRVYEVHLEGGGRETLAAFETFHVPMMSWDGITGLAPIEHCRQSVGLGLAAEKFGARFFGSGSVAGGTLETDDEIEKDVRDEMIAEWNQRLQGPDRSALIAVLHSGMKYKPIGIDPDHAQFLETRKFQVGDVARIFGVPPWMIGDVDKTTSWGTGIEQQGIGFVTYALRPRIIAWETEVNRKLLMPSERGRLYCKLNVAALLRGDWKSRVDGYAKAVGRPWMTANEARALEDQNPLDGGDDLARPLNMGADGDEKEKPLPMQDDEDEDDANDE